MKKLKLKQSVKNILGVILFYAIIVGGVIALNARFEQLEQQKSTDISYQASQYQLNR
mgnify:CR=1 FL=1